MLPVLILSFGYVTLRQALQLIILSTRTDRADADNDGRSDSRVGVASLEFPTFTLSSCCLEWCGR
jgi:hypothetical protein